MKATNLGIHIVNRISALASQEHNDPQYVKALVYTLSLKNRRQEGDTAVIVALSAAVREAGQPARSILQSILAGTYLSYLQQHRYQLYRRTEIREGSEPGASRDRSGPVSRHRSPRPGASPA